MGKTRWVLLLLGGLLAAGLRWGPERDRPRKNLLPGESSRGSSALETAGLPVEPLSDTVVGGTSSRENAPDGIPAPQNRLQPEGALSTGLVTAEIPACYSDGIRIVCGPASLRQHLAAGAASPRIDETDGAHYKNVWPGVDAFVTFETDRVEEFLRISPGAASVLMYDFRIESPGESFRNGEGLEVVAADGEPVLRMTEVLYTRMGEETQRRPETSVALLDAKTARLTITIPVEDRAHEILLDPGWTVTGSLPEARSGFPAVRLLDGRVLVAGGHGWYAGVVGSCRIYDPVTGTWTSTGALSDAREYHTMTLLADGRVLVTGGVSNRQSQNSGPVKLATCEIYDPVTGMWTSARRLSEVRYHHTATRLNDGRVLVTGGSPKTAWAQIYDPSTNRWTSTTPTYAGSGWSLLLAGGDVLVTRGDYNAEVYHPAGNQWSRALSFAKRLTYSKGALLPNGKVLAAGSVNLVFLPNGAYTWELSSACQVYDPTTNRWSVTGSMAAVRHSHTLSPLAGGTALTAGGHDRLTAGGTHLGSCEIYNPATGLWNSTSSLIVPRSSHSAVALQNGAILVMGGSDASYQYTAACEIYTP